MKKLGGILLVLLVLFIGCGFTSCTKGDGIGGTTIGNGKIDPIEKLTIIVAVNLALDRHPEFVKPACIVSGSVLNALGGKDGVAVPVTIIDSVIMKELANLKLSDTVKAEFMVLFLLQYHDPYLCIQSLTP